MLCNCGARRFYTTCHIRVGHLESTIERENRLVNFILFKWFHLLSLGFPDLIAKAFLHTEGSHNNIDGQSQESTAMM